MNQTDTLAETIYRYTQLNQTLQKADALFVLCSHDTRVATYAAELYLEGLAPWLMISGGVGELTKQEQGRDFDSFILIQKSSMERRTYATFAAQWPDADTKIQVSSPRLSYEKYFDGAIDKELAISVMLGDLQRIKEYPARGFQIEQDIPEEVWSAFESLVAMRYDQHLLQ